MPIFLAVPLTPTPATLDESVVKHIPNPADRHHLQGGRGWLIRFEGTTIELTNHLMITSPQENQTGLIGSVIVTPVSSYYGRGPTEMWEWLATRMST